MTKRRLKVMSIDGYSSRCYDSRTKERIGPRFERIGNATAYALGWNAGYNYGEERGKGGMSGERITAYMVGYEAGVAQYCRDTETQEPAAPYKGA